MEEEIYGRIMADLGRILRQQYEMKWMKIYRSTSGYIYMLINITLHLPVSVLKGYLKAKRSLMLFDRNAILKTSTKNSTYDAALTMGIRWEKRRDDRKSNP